MEDLKNEDVETEVVETEVNEDVETETDIDSDVETDEETEENGTEEPTEEELAKRAYYAEKKRQDKAKKAEQKVVEANPVNLDKNPFTGLPITDEEDKKEYLDMLEAKSKGYDPKDYVQMSKFLREKRLNLKAETLKQEAQIAKEQEEKKTFIRNDYAQFTKDYPDVDLKTLQDNKLFNIVAKTRIGKESLSEIYKDFLEVENSLNTRAETEKQKALARTKSTPGALNTEQEGITDDKSGMKDPVAVKKWLNS